MKLFPVIFFKIIFCIFLFAFSSCLKKKYEGPPDTSGYDPELKVTSTIAELITTQQGIAIPGDIIIAGLVVMDDKSGNYSRKIVIEDSTGGIEVLLDQSNLYNDFPVGRKLYIKCKGLYVGNYGGNPQLGYTPDNTGSVSSIPALLISDFVVKADYPNKVISDTLTIADLSKTSAAKYLNKLITIRDIEFVDSTVGIPYAQLASIASATSLSMKDCNGNLIMLRTSGYARFQPYLTPGGNGTITGIFSKYKDELQLSIRDTTDVYFRNVRCDGSSGGEILFSQDFSALTDNAEIALTDWINFSEIGERKFTKGTFQSDVYAKITSYGGTVPAIVKSWLITPSINLAGKSNLKLTFRTKDGFDNGATLKAYVSTDYSGSGNPVDATWTDLNAVISSGHVSNYATEWTVANVHLNDTGSIRIAFKYEGGDDKTTTYELGYIKITTD
ncbi:hypothetical protein F0919_09150 [Taibaiella lutea]|uniref:DUF5689 domain-containing protein n=1 Tax=Taibaiella lutea TaxID=2608001 RepID=A0A5M6CI27_9BACT|nr:DUF5689 domain-containing protein [Taibaiella lutea]KAA5534764.1 hypothetical protein F0919_09150 [Taibaiella lutea]